MRRPCRNGQRRTAVATAVLLVVLIAYPSISFASSKASVTSTSAVTSASWGAVLASTSVTSVPSCPSSPVCAAYTFTWESSGLLALLFAQPFDAWNTGTVSLTGESFYGTWSGGGSIKLETCSVALTLETILGTDIYVCRGTSTTITSSLTSATYYDDTTSGTYPASAGSEVFLYAQAGSGGGPSNGTSITLSASVCSGSSGCSDQASARQIREAVTTNA